MPVTAERLLAKRRIDPDTGCWEWMGSRTSGGYGQIRKGQGNHRYVHREAARVLGGMDIEGVVVRHSCDNPPCFNPDHLLTGTHGDNVADKIARGRIPVGEDAGTTKLTPAQVVELRRLRGEGWTLRALGARFGINNSTVHAIVHRQTWRHLVLPDQATDADWVRGSETDEL